MRLGIGDDAAIVEVKRGQEMILTTDMSIEGVHFRRQLHPARSVGHRALARSLSDIAAMGGTPRYALVSLALNRRATRAWIRDFYSGMLELARRFRVELVGGDTARVRGVTTIDVVVAGEVPRGGALRRSGARPGDQLYVSGRLGLSAWGLQLLESRTRIRGAEQEHALQAHLYPEPKCALGRFLRQRRLASALMDLSDGLSTDLARLCEASEVGAQIRAASLPGPQVEDKTNLDLALHGGEDYELLFAVPPRKARLVPRRFRSVPLYWIGEVQQSRKLQLIGNDGKARLLELRGWDHFQTKA